MKGKNKNKPVVSRRSFLGTAGLALGVSTLTPVVPAFDSILKYGNKLLTGKSLKAGVLLPGSNIYPAMSENFLAGLKLSLSQAQQKIPDIQIDLEPMEIGFGPSSIVKKSRVLIEQENVDILTGIISESASRDMHDLLDETDKFLIANHSGANTLKSQDHSPNIVYNSLNLWQTNYALGKWAAHNVGKKAVVASSFYESGYDALYAFISGFESQGGIILDTQITNLPYEMVNRSSVIDEIKKYQADLVFASFSGSEAEEFVSEYIKSGLNRSIPLMGSAFLVEENIKINSNAVKAGILTSSSWTSDLQNEVHRKFQSDFNQLTGRSTDAFAVLGFETGSIITQAVANSNGNLNNPVRLRNVLYNNKISGPRGMLKLNKQTHAYESPLYLRELRKNNGKAENIFIADLDPVKEDIMQAEDLKTGWLNPYLCA